MKFVLPLLLVVSLAHPSTLGAADPAHIDATERNTRLAPTPDNADMPLSPNRPANQRPFFRNEHLQDQRFSTPQLIDRKEAVVGERRAPIDLTEKREKVIVDRKDYPKPEVRDRQINRHDGERARIQPQGDAVKRYDTVSKYQNRMADAKNATAQREPQMEKRTSFEKLNRFIFKRNGPGTPDGRPMVTTAGGGSMPPSPRDTHTQYQIDWQRAQPAR